MSNASEYTPPEVWTWDKANGGRFASINRPVAGPTHDKDLPVGRHQVRSRSTVTVSGLTWSQSRTSCTRSRRKGASRASSSRKAGRPRRWMPSSVPLGMTKAHCQ